MCNFLSGIATKEKVYIDWRLDSHTGIIEYFGLEKFDKMNGKNEIGLVRWELTPDNPMTLEFDKWTFKTDQDIIPSWFDKEKTHKAAIEYLKAQKPLGDCKIFLGQALFATGKIRREFGFIRYLLGGSVNEVRDGGSVNEVWGGGSVNQVWGGGSVNQVWGGGSVNEVRDGGSVNQVWGGGSVNQVRDGGSVNQVRDGGSVNEVWGGGSVNEVWGGGSVNQVWDGGSVNQVWDGGSVNQVRDGGQIKKDYRKKIQK